MNGFDWIYRFTRWGLGVVFIVAGSLKLAAPATFAILIDAYGVLPDSLATPAAVLLPALEVAAGFGLLFDIKGSLTIIAALLIMFIVILAYGIGMGLDVDCGCFGPDDPESEAFHGLRQALYRDGAMLAAVAFLFGWRRYRAIVPVSIYHYIDNRLKKRRMKDAFGQINAEPDADRYAGSWSGGSGDGRGQI